MTKLRTIYDLKNLNYNLKLINTTNYLKSNNDNNWLSKSLKLLTSISISYSYELVGNDEILLNIVKLIENYSNKPMNLLMLDDNVTCISYK